MAAKQKEPIRVNAYIDDAIYPQLFAEMMIVKKNRPRLVASRIIALANLGLMAERGLLPTVATNQSPGTEEIGNTSAGDVPVAPLPPSLTISNDEANELGAVFGDNAFGSQNN